MDRITPIPSPTLPATAAKPIACEDALWVPLPEQDVIERNSLIAIEAWQKLFTDLPLEIVSIIFTETLFGLTLNEILNIAEYQRGKLKPEAWSALYKASIFCFGSIEELSEWLSNPKQFRNFVEDAQKYGDKTLRQIFYGLQLLEKTKDSITIEDCMRAGMIDRERICSENALPSIRGEQDFLSWLCGKKARIVICLRWLPAQTHNPEARNPDLLEEAVKQGNCTIVKQVCAYMKKHRLHDGAVLHPCRNALWRAVIDNDVPIAQYLFDEFPDFRFTQGLLQISAAEGCLPMVQLLIERKIEINELDDYQKTALQTVIGTFYPYQLSPSYWLGFDEEGRQKTLDQLDVIIFLLRQYVDKGLDFDINWELQEQNTFLHMACYVQNPDSAEWLAQFILEQQKDKNLFDTQNEDGKTPFMCALEADNYPMYTFLQEQQAKRVLGTERFPLLSREEFQALRTASNRTSSTPPSTKPVLPASTSIQNDPPVAVQPRITASYAPSAQEISWLHTWVQAFVDLSKYLLTMVFFIPRTLYVFYLNVIQAWISRVSER